ncbi:MAG: cellobiose-specific phosphotransferase system component IIC, partial [Psychromonas sp.]
MNSWALFLLIAAILGIVVGNIMLLKHSANMKLPEEVKQAIAKRKA